MAKTYAIFQVYDYKGGELNPNINLSYKPFINVLAGLFNNVDFDGLAEQRDRKIEKILDSESSDIEHIKNILIKVTKDPNFYSRYAGAIANGFCGRIYEVEDGMMRNVSIVDYIDDIAKVLSPLIKGETYYGSPLIKGETYYG